MPARAPVPANDGPIFYSAIVLMGAPVGVLLMMVQQSPQGWLAALVSGCFSGVISVGWAYTFIRERWWILIPLLPLSFVLPGFVMQELSRTGLFAVGMSPSPPTRLIVLAIMCMAFSACGFTLFITHLRGRERRSARALAELDLARQVHTTLAAPITLRTPLAEVYARSIPSSTMGGDLIDAIAEPGGGDGSGGEGKSGGGCLNVLIGDVSGHGIAAGVVMAMLKGCVRTRLLHSAPLDQVVADANTVLADLTAPNMFATFVALRLLPGRTLQFALAGHLPIFHFRAAESRWDRYPNQSLPLGVDPGERFVSGTASVAPGDILAVYTDGLMEVQNSSGRELGLEGVARLLAAAPSASLPAMHAAILSGVAAHGPQLDDQSLVLVRVV